MKNKLLMAVALSAAVVLSAQAPALAEKSTETKADNSKLNKQMREKGEATADQQKENPADRKISQLIRRAVVKNKSLSTYAHNVKIITQDGEVTLKGPVRSEKEKNSIEKAAAKVAGKGHVTNELTVEPEEK